MFLFRRLAAALLLLCAPAWGAPVPPPDLTVFAAASLKESLDDTARLWQRRSGQRVVVSYAASSALARQIEQGAPADVFVSADGEWMDYLQSRQLIVAASRVDLVRNRLVVVVPADSPVATLVLSGPDPLSPLLGSGGRLAVAGVQAVPAGRYARAALEHRGWWPGLAPRLAQGDDVRTALAYVARGEAPAGIVYATDARVEPRVRVVATFDAGDHPDIVYPAARVAASSTPGAAAFLRFLRGPQARAVFVRAGFTVP